MKKKKNKKLIVFIVITILLILVAGGILAYKIYQEQNKPEEKVEQAVVVEEVKPPKEVQIFKGNDRPIAVMIDNHTGAWPQAGLNNAYMVYEIIVEGGETRLMACFKGVNLEKIGPVRSARHYFIDYVMENDAIYAHYGWSPQAESDISKYGINNLNGITESTSTFWRVKDKSAPHNAVTSTEAILNAAKAKSYRTTSSKESVLHYVAEDVELKNAMSAIQVTIPHSNLQTVTYEYDASTQKYNRYAREKAQTDWDTQAAVAPTNIIITFCDNYDLDDGENKGRQGLYNIGTYDGYYITKGKAIKIKCIKTARDEKTKYVDLEGNTIDVNDGNTFVQICPINAQVNIQGVQEQAPTNEVVSQ